MTASRGSVGMPPGASALHVGDAGYAFYDLRDALSRHGLGTPEEWPATICVLAENVLRGNGWDAPLVDALRDWKRAGRARIVIPFRPARVLLQDYTGIPVLVDLAALRHEAEERGLPLDDFACRVPADLIVDHSVSVDEWGHREAASRNAAIEVDRNVQRFAFLRWAAARYEKLRVFPPQSGICHQINMEFLASVVHAEAGGCDAVRVASPDTVLGADSHTTMINGLGVLGWGVGGIEALLALLGHPLPIALPEVVGVKLLGHLPENATATDLVLSLTERFRSIDLVGRFVEFFGPGVASLGAPHRATVANMAPEAGATCAFFPVDGETLRYLAATGREPEEVRLVEAYAKRQGLWRDGASAAPRFSQVIEFDLAAVEPCVAGPHRPDERLPLGRVAHASRQAAGGASANDGSAVKPGDVVIAAITSCTNTANPESVFTAALLARNAVRAGLSPRPWVKTSFAPGSRVVREYLARSGLQAGLDALGFTMVGFGCTTCIGQAGPLQPEVARSLDAHACGVSAVLSGNRNFAHRVHAQVPLNFLASPALVVAYALAGSTHTDLAREPLGVDRSGAPVFLRDLWPSRAEVEAQVAQSVGADLFRAAYREPGTMAAWTGAAAHSDAPHPWDVAPTYVTRPPIHRPERSNRLAGARILAMYGDRVTTDQISPASPIAADSAAGRYLLERGIDAGRLHTFGARRGHWEVMLNGAFTNPSLVNELLGKRAPGMTRHLPSGEVLAMPLAAERYRAEGTPVVIVAGKGYGVGSSRDDAAKSTRNLGVRAVIAESFERIHRSNLLALGVLPLAFPRGVGRKSLALTGEEAIDIDLAPLAAPGATLACRIAGRADALPLRACIETEEELAYWRAGGLLAFLLDRSAECAIRPPRT